MSVPKIDPTKEPVSQIHRNNDFSDILAGTDPHVPEIVEESEFMKNRRLMKETLEEMPIIKLNLGSGKRVKEGYVNVDIHRFPGVDLVCDLADDWPFNDDVVDEVIAKDIFEHLPDIIHTMNELYRVLAPGGRAHIYVPSTDSLAAFADPTHKSYWNGNTIVYFIEGGMGDLYPHLIKAKFKLIAAKKFVYVDVPQSTGVYFQLEKPKRDDVEENSNEPSSGTDLHQD